MEMPLGEIAASLRVISPLGSPRGSGGAPGTMIRATSGSSGGGTGRVFVVEGAVSELASTSGALSGGVVGSNGNGIRHRSAEFISRMPGGLTDAVNEGGGGGGSSDAWGRGGGRLSTLAMDPSTRGSTSLADSAVLSTSPRKGRREGSRTATKTDMLMKMLAQPSDEVGV